MNSIEKKLLNLFEKSIGRQFNRKEERLFSTLIFLIRLLIFSIPLYLIIGYQISLLPLQQVVASQTENVLNVMGYNIQADNTRIKINKDNPFIFVISEDCTGWKSMLFFTALIFAVPGVAALKRTYGLLFGLPIIWIGNIIRIIIVVLSEDNLGLSAAMIIHDYLWQAGLIALVLSLWIIWMKLFHVIRT